MKVGTLWYRVCFLFKKRTRIPITDKIRYLFISRRRQYLIVREIRQIRKNFKKPDVDLLNLVLRLDSLMILICGRTNVHWQKCWEEVVQIASKRLGCFQREIDSCFSRDQYMKVLRKEVERWLGRVPYRTCWSICEIWFISTSARNELFNRAALIYLKMEPLQTLIDNLSKRLKRLKEGFVSEFQPRSTTA